jgi:hypothetical protein
MLERADARLWFPMIGIVSAIPAVVFAISAIWFMRFYIAPPTILAAAPLGQSALAAMSAKPAALESSEPIADPAPAALAQTEAPALQLRQQPTETAEVVAALPDAEASELASAPPAVAPRMLGDAHPAYSDPAQDISTVVSAAMSAKPAALEPSDPIEGPIPLPRRKPRVTFVHVSRAVSLARSPTVASSPRPTSQH